MLDKPEKTHELMEILDAAVPFEVGLMPDLIDHLARQQNPVVIKSSETVSKVSYSGDFGGIMCHIQARGRRERARGLAYARSRAPQAPLCSGRARLSEASSEEAQETGRNVDRIGRLVSRGHHRGRHTPHSTIGVPCGARAHEPAR